MINTITLSPDMDKLFLIEEKQVLSFALTHKNGILITQAGGQITAATGSGATPAGTKVYEYVLNKRQLQVAFSVAFNKAFIIIIEDIDFNLGEEKAQEHKTVAKDFSMKKSNLLLKRVENKLLVYLLPKGIKDDVTAQSIAPETA
jgi:hypothetical protein